MQEFARSAMAVVVARWYPTSVMTDAAARRKPATRCLPRFCCGILRCAVAECEDKLTILSDAGLCSNANFTRDWKDRPEANDADRIQADSRSG